MPSLNPQLKNILCQKCSILFLLQVLSSSADSHNGGNTTKTALWGSGSFSAIHHVASVSSAVKRGDCARKCWFFFFLFILALPGLSCGMQFL